MQITMDLLQMEQIMALSAYAKTTADLIDKKRRTEIVLTSSEQPKPI
jgi:hypothetical protein